MKVNNSERPVDALAENGKLLTHLLTTSNQEMLAHLKTFRFHISYLLSKNTTMASVLDVDVDAIWLFQKKYNVIVKNSFGMQLNVKLIQQIICNL